MSRTIEFDTKEMISSAMQAFWTHGSKTTLKHIEKSTGLNKSSIYNTFGNKDALFGLAMKCYVEELEEWVNTSCGELTFKDFLHSVLQDAANDNFEGRGCFFYNCLGSKDAFSKKNKVILDSAYLKVRSIFEKRIFLAIESNELKFDKDIASYATLMMMTIAGLRAFNLSGLPNEDLKNAAKVAFKTLTSG